MPDQSHSLPLVSTIKINEKYVSIMSTIHMKTEVQPTLKTLYSKYIPFQTKMSNIHCNATNKHYRKSVENNFFLSTTSTFRS